MGAIPADSWLPLLPTRKSVGPLPASLQERHEMLYRTFADAWRVTDETSLFVYEPGTSTKSATDRDWPAAKPPCTLLPQFEVPGANPPTSGLPERAAERLCRRVKDDALHRDCVFDVATTGDESFAPDYLLKQDLRRRATSVQVIADPPFVQHGSAVNLTATVLPMAGSDVDSVTPTGSVTFHIDGAPAGKPVRVDKQGRATVVLDRLDRGQHRVRAEYGGGGRRKYRPCSSGTLVVAIGDGRNGGHDGDDGRHDHDHRLRG